MKLDPGMHIGMHLVSFGKPGVTAKEEQVERQDAADAPGSEATPVVTRKGEEAARVEEGAGPERGQPRRRRERLRCATVFPESATPTPST
jgi:hypothetical protein